MFGLVKIQGRKLTITGFFDDGRMVDECTIDKDKDLITPYALAPVYDTVRTCFKGYTLGLAGVNAVPEQVDGVWHLPFGTLAAWVWGLLYWAAGKV